MKKSRSLLAGLLIIPAFAVAQRQYEDSSYMPPAFESRYETGKGTVIYLDEAHHNFHTRTGRYAPFARVLEQDGFRVRSNTGAFTMENLKDMKILVIANALPVTSVERWEAPTQSAFTEDEILVVKKWVKKGGRLLLLADHMPMGGAARDLAAAFGFTFYDSFADDTTTSSSTELFTKSDRSLADNIITRGSASMFEVDSVTSFTGQAFRIPEGAHSILHCGDGWIVRLPKIAWQFDEETEILDASGWSQAACLEFGKGKVVVFGEAAMFSAQIAEIEEYTIKAGMNNDKGKNNYRLLLNVARWLDE